MSRARVPVTSTGRHGGVGGVVIGSHERNTMRVDTILQQACANGVLRLANRNLTEVPREVFFLHETDYKDKRWWEEQELTVFDISNNMIQSMPVPAAAAAARGPSAHSQSRPLFGGRPTELSSTRCDDDDNEGRDGFTQAFSQLRLLNASYNKLSAFPELLLATCARTLTKLELSHNQLSGEGLPFATPSHSATNHSSVITFASLLELDVSHNRLQCLAHLISMCPRLEKLQASNNQLVQWIEGGGGASSGVALSLRHVDLSCNHLTSLSWADGSTLAQRCPNLMHLNASKNKITCDGVDVRMPERNHNAISVSAFPQSLVTLDLKFNQLGRWPAQLFGSPPQQHQGNLTPLPHLKELFLGRNQLPTPPVGGDALATLLPALEMLDASDNQIQDATFLLPLKGSLSRLDLQNNNLSTLPAELGLFPKLKNVVLDGNPLRAIRRDVIAKGTVELLSFLRDRLPASNRGAVPGSQQIRTLEPHVIQAEQQYLSPAAAAAAAALHEATADPTRHLLGRRSQQSTAAAAPMASSTARAKVDDRPFATAFNANAVVPEEVKVLNSACIRAGERSGTLWNLNGGISNNNSGSMRPTISSGRRAGGFGGSAGGPLSNGAGAGNSGAAAELPELVSHALNFAELHASTEQKFRDAVLTISMEHQQQMKALSLDFLLPFPKLRELNCSRCPLLETILPVTDHVVGQHRRDDGPPLSALSSLDLSYCAVHSSNTAQRANHSPMFDHVASSLDGALQTFAQWRSPIARLNLAFNPRLAALPTSLLYVANTLQYLRLDGNQNLGGQQSLSTWSTLGQLPQLVELSIPRCSISDMPPDQATPWMPHVDARKGFCESSWPRLLLLDIANNELTNIPNTVGMMKGHLRQLSVEGNRVRWLRQETLSKGTVAVLQYLADRIPQQ